MYQRDGASGKGFDPPTKLHAKLIGSFAEGAAVLEPLINSPIFAARPSAEAEANEA